MPSKRVTTTVTLLPEECEVTGADVYWIEVADMLPMDLWCNVDDKTVTCPIVDKIVRKYNGDVFTIAIPLQFTPDNTDAFRNVFRMLRKREDIWCITDSNFLWIDSVHVGE